MLHSKAFIACLAVVFTSLLLNRQAHATQSVVFKFPDDSCVEADGAELSSGEIDVEAANDELVIAGAEDILPLIDMDVEDMQELRAEAEAMSGQPAVDMTQYFWAQVDSGGGDLVAALLLLEIIEDAYVMPEPSDPPCHEADNLAGGQTYRANAPAGVGANTVQASSGNRGGGITIADVEFNWNRSHEDLCDAVSNGLLPDYEVDLVPSGIENIANCDPPTANRCRIDHGTAVLGILLADQDGTGVDGIASEALVKLVTDWPENELPNIPRALYRAASMLEAGDVLLIEKQEDSGCTGYGFMPVEMFSGNYNAILQATQRGIHVVEASGNGGEDLDAYREESDCTTGDHAFRLDHRTASYRDSGAVLVGASTSAVPADRIYSCFGERIDAYSRGSGVRTLGSYNGASPDDGENRDYTASFSGSSSASAIVAACVAVVSGKHADLYDKYYPPDLLRVFLRTSGTLPDPSDLIGRQPNLVDQLDILDMGPYPAHVFTGFEPDPGDDENPGPFGASACGIGDVNSDGEPDILVGAPLQDTSSYTDAGAVYLYSGLTGALIRTHVGTAGNAKFGWAIASGDVTGDDIDDYAISAPGAGYVYVFDGTDGSAVGSAIGSGVQTAKFGNSLAIGDLNDDGFADIAIGAPTMNLPAPGGGRILVISGEDGSTLLDVNNTAGSPDESGWVVAISDVTGDGKPDLLAGEPGHSSSKGRVRAFANESFNSLTIDGVEGSASGDEFGRGLATFDMDGDGVDEVAVGAPGGDSSDGWIKVFESNSATAVRTITGDGSTDKFGERLANAGAWDDDFLLTGGPKEDLLVACAPLGEVRVFTLISDSTPFFVYEGQASGSTLGTAASGPGPILLGDPAALGGRGRIYRFKPAWLHLTP